MRIGTFAKAAMNVASGTAAAQAISFGFTFALAGLYDQAAFGHFTVFLSCLGVLGVSSTGSYDKAVMFARSRHRWTALVTLVWTIVAVVAVCASLSGLLFIVMDWPSPFGLTHVEHALLLPLGCMLFAGSQLSVYVCLKADRLTRLGGLKVAHSAVTGGTQCALVSISAVGGLALGQVFGLLIMALPALAVLRNALASMSQNAWLRVRASARRFSRYPKFVCPSELVDALANQAPLLAIGSVFSLEVLGAYGFAQRILAAPAALVGQAVGQIFLQRVSRRDTDRSAIKSLMIRVWLSMGALGIVPFAALFIFGGQLFEFLFGTRWLSAGEIAAASAPLLFLRFISSPTSTVYYRLELQSWQLVLAVMALFVRTGAVFAHFFGANIIEVIYLQTAGEILVIGMYNAIAWNRLARRSH